jgi:excisionase family DNA binding protein
MAEKKIDLDELKGDAFLEVKDVAEILQVHPRTVLRLISESGELRAIRVGGRWRIRRKDLEEYIQTHLHFGDINPDVKIISTNADSASNDSQKKEFIDSGEQVMNEAMLNDQISVLAPREKEALQKPPSDEVLLTMPAHFVGRNEDLKWLLERLEVNRIVRIAVLGGLGGIGKTALTAMVVHQLRKEGRFHDGVAVVFCQDFHHDDEPKVLQSVLARFDPQHRSPEISDLADLSETFQQMFDGKDVLIVLDNIEPDLEIEKVVIPLQAAGATLLLTARQALSYTSIPVDASHTLDLLSSDEALDLFAYSLGRESAEHLNDTENTAAKRIIKALDRHTLAVKLAGAYAAHLHRDLVTLARELEDPQRAFELPEGEVPQAMMRVFMRSIIALPPDEQRLFAALTAFETGDFSRNAAIALAEGLHLSLPETSLDRLVLRALVDAYVNRSMPEWSDRERLHLHPLLRALSVREFKEWKEDEQEVACKVLASYYAKYIYSLLDTSSDHDESSENIDHSAVNIILEQDIVNITNLLPWLLDHNQDVLIVAICSGLQYFWFERGDTQSSLSYLSRAIEASKAIHEKSNVQLNPLLVANMLLSYGRVLQFTGQLEKANHYYRERLEVAQMMHDKGGESDALHHLGRLARQLGELDDAENYYKQALVINREVGNKHGEGWTLAFLGQVQQDRGNLEEAEALYQQALAIQHELKQRRAEGWFLGYLGRLALDQGQLKKAKEYYLQHFEIAKDMHDLRSEGVCFSFLGQIALKERRYNDAEDLLHKAHSILHGVDLQSEGWVLNYLGQLTLNLEQYEIATQNLEKAFSIFQEVQDLRGKSVVLTQLALIAERKGDLDHAEKLYRESLDICRKSQYGQIIADALFELGRFLVEQRSDQDQGCPMLLETIQRYREMKLPREEEAQKIVRKLNCMG